MNQINVKKFGIASGITGSLIYLGCFFLMSVLGEKVFIKFSNLLFHGVDFSNIIRMNITIIETLIGVVVSFIFWGIVGYLLTLIYNKL